MCKSEILCFIHSNCTLSFAMWQNNKPHSADGEHVHIHTHAGTYADAVCYVSLMQKIADNQSAMNVG